jgi:hypothetical protein
MLSPFRLSIIASLIFAAIGGIRVASTWRVFNQTWDEPYSVSCGMEWLQHGTYQRDPKHPPLGRIAAASWLYLKGVRGTTEPYTVLDGNSIFGGPGVYRSRLTLARLGVLPFFFLGCAAVWCWAFWSFDAATAAVAVLLFSLMPPVLGNAGIAMTDIALTATLPLALLCFCRWLAQPTPALSLALGSAVGIAVLSQFTALPFFAVSAALFTIAWRANMRAATGSGFRTRAARSLLAGLAAALVIWAGYRFSVTFLAGSWFPLPAKPFFTGLQDLWLHNEGGQWNSFLGERSMDGWLYYFPVLIAVKSPAAALILVACGLAFLVRARGRTGWRSWTMALAAAAIIAVGCLSRIDLGIRHILPAYVPLAGLAAFGAVQLFRAGTAARVACILLLGWCLVSSARAHPDYLAYFNEFADASWGRFGVDSDLDYGQDLWRLTAACERRHVRAIWIAYNGTVPRHQMGAEWRDLPPDQPQPGWIAISIRDLKLGLRDDLDAYSWLESYRPVERVGKSILLYYIPPSVE